MPTVKSNWCGEILVMVMVGIIIFAVFEPEIVEFIGWNKPVAESSTPISPPIVVEMPALPEKTEIAHQPPLPAPTTQTVPVVPNPELEALRGQVVSLGQQLDAEAKRAEASEERTSKAESQLATALEVGKKVAVLEQELEKMKMQPPASPPIVAVLTPAPSTPPTPPVVVRALPPEGLKPGPFHLEVILTSVMDNPASPAYTREIAVVIGPSGLWVGGGTVPPQIVLPLGVQEQPSLQQRLVWFPAGNRWLSKWTGEIPPWLPRKVAQQQYRQ